MNGFLTTTQTQPPTITVFWFVVMMLTLLGLAILTVKYREYPFYNLLFKGIQIIQLVGLYAWYIGFQLPVANSLPVYHCRLAMFALVLLPDRWPAKQYFALMGVSGAIFALGYPVLDPYDFPHITGYSFLIGHYALFVNGLSYLLRQYDSRLLSFWRIVVYTSLLNAVLVGINQVTGGNYGLLRDTPLIGPQPLVVKYLAVTLVLTLALLLFDVIFKKRELAPKQVLDRS